MSESVEAYGEPLAPARIARPDMDAFLRLFVSGAGTTYSEIHSARLHAAESVSAYVESLERGLAELRLAAAEFEGDLSEWCDCPELDRLRALLNER